MVDSSISNGFVDSVENIMVTVPTITPTDILLDSFKKNMVLDIVGTPVSAQTGSGFAAFFIIVSVVTFVGLMIWIYHKKTVNMEIVYMQPLSTAPPQYSERNIDSLSASTVMKATTLSDHHYDELDASDIKVYKLLNEYRDKKEKKKMDAFRKEQKTRTEEAIVKYAY